MEEDEWKGGGGRALLENQAEKLMGALQGCDCSIIIINKTKRLYSCFKVRAEVIPFAATGGGQ